MMLSILRHPKKELIDDFINAYNNMIDYFEKNNTFELNEKNNYIAQLKAKYPVEDHGIIDILNLCSTFSNQKHTNDLMQSNLYHNDPVIRNYVTLILVHNIKSGHFTQLLTKENITQIINNYKDIAFLSDIQVDDLHYFNFYYANDVINKENFGFFESCPSQFHENPGKYYLLSHSLPNFVKSNFYKRVYELIQLHKNKKEPESYTLTYDKETFIIHFTSSYCFIKSSNLSNLYVSSVKIKELEKWIETKINNHEFHDKLLAEMIRNTFYGYHCHFMDEIIYNYVKTPLIANTNIKTFLKLEDKVDITTVIENPVVDEDDLTNDFTINYIKT